MPGFDGTGPRGMGPMTGGGRGFCAVPLSASQPGYMGRALPWTPQMTREQELDFLKNEAQAMREQLEQIESRVQQLSK